jgi:integrase
MALTWARLDWKNRLLTIADDRTHRTKNRKSRVVGVPKELADRLAQQRKDQGAEEKPARPMFPAMDGTVRTDPSWFREAFRRACAKANLEQITFHELRHSFVMNALRCTKDLAGVSKTAGHHDPGYTARRYGHLVPEWSLAIADATAEYVRAAAGAAGA